MLLQVKEGESVITSERRELLQVREGESVVTSKGGRECYYK